ncbi:MAG: hypothetical protein UW69_C0070G0004 [Microgenomates group bacterium GW2011_GWA2_44_7]|nr:MAG: hypothetical protein UW69_C0070G0004 [Microgenomates group bacterium GW2011_GWA2_44_7]
MPRGVRKAVNSPVISTKIVADSNDMQVGQPQYHKIPATGSISAEDFKDNFQVVDAPALGGKAAILAFMEEEVVVRLATTADKSQEPIPRFSVNGINQYIQRGKPEAIKRKFLQEIARSKHESINTPFARDGNGFDTYNLSKQHSLKYPFELIEDKNPRGRPWLEKILAEA